MKRPLAELLQQYCDLIRAAPAALVSAGDLERLDAHMEDSLTAVPVIEGLALKTSLVDVGSGGGMPGIPLALALHSLEVSLVESVARKAAFLEECAAAFQDFAAIAVAGARVEEIAVTHRELFDIATARALAPPPVTLEWLAPLIRIGGHAILWTTPTLLAEHSIDGVLSELGFGEPRTEDGSSSLRDDAILLVVPKVEATPAKYPRRTGVAKKRPLA